MMKIHKTEIKSLNLSALNLYGGKWYCQNGSFIDLPEDFWHSGTEYFIAQDEVSYEPLKKVVTDSLITMGKKYVFEKMTDIKFTTIYLPVVPIRIGGFVLYDADIRSKLFSYGKLSEKLIIADNIVSCFNWKELDVDTISHLYKKRLIVPSDTPYAYFLENQQHYGAYNTDSLKMFYMPVVEMSCKIDGKEYRFSALGDRNASSYAESCRIPVEPLLEKGELNVAIDKRNSNFTTVLLVIGIIVAIGGVVMRYIYFPDNLGEFLIGAIMWLIIWGIAMFLIIYLSLILEYQMYNLIDWVQVPKRKFQLKRALRKKRNEAVKLGFLDAKNYEINFSKDKSGQVTTVKIKLKK